MSKDTKNKFREVVILYPPQMGFYQYRKRKASYSGGKACESTEMTPKHAKTLIAFTKKMQMKTLIIHSFPHAKFPHAT